MMNLHEAAQATGGYIIDAGHGEGVRFCGVSTDSRAILPGELFVALKGDNFDGYDYLSQALERGAVAALVDKSRAQEEETGCRGLPLLAVVDTRRALGDLARYWRSRFFLPLIGITGSNGKTTVKEMCAAILREQARRDGYDAEQSVLATTGNLNNDIGLPLMLLRLRDTHRAAVIEMGMNHPGEIAYLTRIARPTVALVNNAQRAHLAGLGSVADVARAKGEIFEGLSEGGVAVINADDPHAGLWCEMNAKAHRVISFGLEQLADVSAHCALRKYGSMLRLHTQQGMAGLDLHVLGLHNVRNALAATAATLPFATSLDAVAAGLSGYKGMKGRLQLRPAVNGAMLIDDSYNANPDSVLAAIDVLAATPGKKIFVFGDMGEVGDASGQFHDEIGGYAKSRGIDRLFGLGDYAATAVRNFDSGAMHFKTPHALVEALLPLLDADTTVLVKGSRFMKMERVTEVIASQDEKK